MKVKIALFITFFTNCVLFAQFSGSKLKLEDIEKLKQGTVIVAFSDDQTTNEIATEVMSSYWTVSKFKVIKKSELDAYLIANPENFILTYLFNNSALYGMSSKIVQTSSSIKTTYSSFKAKEIGDGLILVQNLKKMKRLKPADAMVYTFIDNDLDAVSNVAEFDRQVGLMNSILSFPNLTQDQLGGWKVSTINPKEVMSKELWISDLDMTTKEKDIVKMKTAYEPYKYKVVSKQEIAQAILDKRSDIVYLSSVLYQPGMYIHLTQCPENNRVLHFMACPVKGFDHKSFEKIKSGKVYGN